MATSKILIDGVGIDLTQDTVAANKMLSGYTAHNSNGDIVTGNIQTWAGTQASGVKSITENGTFDVSEFASAAVNVRDEHFIRAEVTIPSKQTAAFTAITDPMIAAHYMDDTALARYRCTTGQDGRYEGLQTNNPIHTPADTTYGYYRTNAPGQGNSISISPMYNVATNNKAMLTDANGNLKINATSLNYLSAGTYIVEFMW